jgi:hypothetical protein
LVGLEGGGGHAERLGGGATEPNRRSARADLLDLGHAQLLFEARDAGAQSDSGSWASV